MIKRIFLIIISALTGCTFLPAQEKGMASYYSNRMHGRRMSDGTKYHKDSLTCAHRRYPLGTYLKVTNIKNGKSTVVKVTDRCGRRRIIDLSYAAAKEIGIITAGVAMVRVEKYVKEKGVPYKNEEKVELPELDYEVTQPGGTFMPEWMNNKATEKKTPEKKASGNKKEKTKR